jgi:3-oxoacyl-[acyl-carrier protein] reductase
MVERKHGKIINFASVAVLMTAVPGISTYCGAKGAIITFSKSLADEMKPSGININVIAPRGGDTNFHRASKALPEMQQRVKEMGAAGLTTTPQDIGNAVAFLASDVSNKVNGEVLLV